MPSSSWRSGAHASSANSQNQNVSIWVTSNDLVALEKRLQEEFEQKIQQQQSKSLDILAIFITLFTFISVNVTIFQKVDNERAIYFMLLITFSMITIAWTLFLISNYSKYRLIVMIIGIVCILFMPVFWYIIQKIWDFSINQFTNESYKKSEVSITLVSWEIKK